MPKPLIIETSPDELLNQASALKARGLRFMQCHAQNTNGEYALMVTYSFVDDATNDVTNLRLHANPQDIVPSIGKLYPCAFMFENEMHDLFGVQVEGITIDYRGGFYHLHIPMPMAKVPESAAPSAAPSEE